MRLLKIDSAGQLSLTKEFVDEKSIPEYAILSHTWGADTEEVTFKDLIDGIGKDKSGYKKIRLCGEQAKRDGLQYFWVDTCCIDKMSSAVLQEAIISMFRWYQNATKCYVYLSDVSRSAFDVNNKFNQLPFELAFRKTRWFTRGWTLQELLAPASVIFFSKDWEQLGDKKSRELLVHKRTGIPVRALQGLPLSTFSVKERLSWAEKRETTREEDKAYSLLGIFDICIPVLYGEGRESAFERLLEKIDKPMGNGRLPSPADVPFNLYKNIPQGTHRRGKRTGFRSFGARGAASGIKCFRCDNPHVLKDCFASLETVRQARHRRMMTSDRCVNCGSVGHWVSKCPLEDLLEKRRQVYYY